MVIFRRIGGHIVALTDKEKSKQRIQGTAALVTGAGAAHASGTVAARLMHTSALKENIARSANTVSRVSLNVGATKTAMKTLGIALENGQDSRNLVKRAFKVKSLGKVGSAILLGVGANKILDTTGLHDHPDAKVAIATGTAAIASFGVKSGYLKGVGNVGMKSAVRLSGVAVRKSAKALARTVGKSGIKLLLKRLV